jgi:hypothetical protein
MIARSPRSASRRIRGVFFHALRSPRQIRDARSQEYGREPVTSGVTVGRRDRPYPSTWSQPFVTSQSSWTDWTCEDASA